LLSAGPRVATIHRNITSVQTTSVAAGVRILGGICILLRACRFKMRGVALPAI
jgi:hypothetical protein